MSDANPAAKLSAATIKKLAALSVHQRRAEMALLAAAFGVTVQRIWQLYIPPPVSDARSSQERDGFARLDALDTPYVPINRLAMQAETTERIVARWRKARGYNITKPSTSRRHDVAIHIRPPNGDNRPSPMTAAPNRR